MLFVLIVLKHNVEKFRDNHCRKCYQRKKTKNYEEIREQSHTLVIKSLPFKKMYLFNNNNYCHWLKN